MAYKTNNRPSLTVLGIADTRYTADRKENGEGILYIECYDGVGYDWFQSKNMSFEEATLIAQAFEFVEESLYYDVIIPQFRRMRKRVTQFLSEIESLYRMNRLPKGIEAAQLSNAVVFALADVAEGKKVTPTQIIEYFPKNK